MLAFLSCVAFFFNVDYLSAFKTLSVLFIDVVLSTTALHGIFSLIYESSKELLAFLCCNSVKWYLVILSVTTMAFVLLT